MAPKPEAALSAYLTDVILISHEALRDGPRASTALLATIDAIASPS